MHRLEQQELETVLRRFGDLTTRAQLRAFEVIREYLGEQVKESKTDRQVTERKAALEAMRQVADELNLKEGQAPTTTQFEQTSKQLGLGWTVSRVGRVWEKWRFACEAFAGHRVRKSPRQKALQKANIGKRRAYEDYLTAIRLWLETKPEDESMTAYDDWAREFNEDLPHDQAPVVGWAAIYRSVRVSFADVLRVAHGDADLSDFTPKRGDHRKDYGPLVSKRWVAGERRISDDAAGHLISRRDFPKPVVRLSRTRAWLKTDVEAYFAGESFPAREEYELQDEYLSLAELAALMGKPPRTLKSQTMRRPETAGQVSRKRYWRRDEVERWIKENPPAARLARRSSRYRSAVARPHR